MEQARECVFLDSVIWEFRSGEPFMFHLPLLCYLKYPSLVVESSVTKKLLLSQGPDLHKSFKSHWILYFPCSKSFKLSSVMQTTDFLDCENKTGIIVSRGLICIAPLFTILFSIMF